MRTTTQQKSTKLHLGCGNKYLPGFINVDARDGKNVDLVCDIKDLPFNEESIDEIYMCHSLEHIPMHEVFPYLEYLNRLLKPAKCIYISVPNFQTLSSMYLAGKCNLSNIVRAIHGGQEYPGNLHYISFDKPMLTQMLRGARFQKVETFDPYTYLPKNYSDTSTYKINDISISLNLIATK